MHWFITSRIWLVLNTCLLKLMDARQQIDIFPRQSVDATGNVYKRSLNLNPNPYLATERDGVYQPFTIQPDPYLEKWYVLHNWTAQNRLPSFCSFKEWITPLSNDRMGLVMYQLQPSCWWHWDCPFPTPISPYPVFGGVNSTHYTYKATKCQIDFQYHHFIFKDRCWWNLQQSFQGWAMPFSGQFDVIKYRRRKLYLYTGYVASWGQPVNIKTLSMITLVISLVANQDFSIHQGFEHPLGNLNVTKSSVKTHLAKS